MKTSSRSFAPRRSNWKRRGALFCGCGVLGALLLTVAPRALSQFSLFPASPTAALSNPSLEQKRNRSLSNALAKIDAETVRAYLERWTKAEKTTLSGARPAVYIDSNALARRHPAWRLADGLERGAVSPSDPQIQRALARVQVQNRFAGGGAGAGIAARQLEKGRIVPGQIVRAEAGNPASVSLRNGELDPFFAQSAARDALRARDEAFLARRAIEDAAELARRGAVPEADLPELTPEEALELLNLRLQLLRNLSRTPAQRLAAREEIRVIEARYAALLKAQADAQAARLRAATRDIPNQTRRAGLLQIERAARLTAQKQAAIRRDLLSENRLRVRRDLASASALQLELPKVFSLDLRSSARTQNALDFSSSKLPTDFFETARLSGASKAPLESIQLPARQDRAKTVRRLRQQARLEAAQWARRIASHRGATWSQAKIAPDATAEAIKVAFPRSER